MMLTITFVPNKSFGQLLAISPTKLRFLKIFNLQFFYIQVWFTDQSSKSVEQAHNISIISVIIWCVTYKMRYSIEPRVRIVITDFCLLQKYEKKY